MRNNYKHRVIKEEMNLIIKYNQNRHYKIKESLNRKMLIFIKFMNNIIFVF